MIVHFYFRDWKPPQLSADDERTIADFVTKDGIGHMTARFIRLPIPSVISTGVSTQQIFEYWMAPLFYLGMIIVGGIVGLWGDEVRNKFLQTIGGTIFAVGFVGILFFILSVAVVAGNYAWWLRSLRSKHRAVSE